MSRRHPDLVVGVAAAAVCAGAVTVVPGPLPLRVVSALPLVIALPGYAVTAALFPRREIDWSRRLLLSVALGLSIAILVGLVLNLTPFGLQRASWAVALFVVTAAANGVALVGRARAGATEPVGTAPRSTARRPRVRIREVVLLLAALGILGGAVAFARTPLPAKRVLGYTALWLVPAPSDNPVGLRVGVKSAELERTRYRLLVRVGSRVIYERGLELDSGSEFVGSIRLPAGSSTGDVPVQALLYRDDRPSAVYRRATFWPEKTTAPS